MPMIVKIKPASQIERLCIIGRLLKAINSVFWLREVELEFRESDQESRDERAPEAPQPQDAA